VVPLAAALSIPLVTSGGSLLPHRDLVVLLTAAVIVVTLVVQGFTLAPLVRRAGIALTSHHIRQEHISARLRVARAGLNHLEMLSESETAQEFVIAQLRDRWQARIERIGELVVEQPSSSSAAEVYRRLRRELLAVEGAELTRLFEAGEITDTTRRGIQRLLDLEHAGLGDDEG
jgi:CPA1 family monovalent cation:H+ antiporter